MICLSLTFLCSLKWLRLCKWFRFSTTQSCCMFLYETYSFLMFVHLSVCRKCITKKLNDEETDHCPVCNIGLGVVPMEKLRLISFRGNINLFSIVLLFLFLCNTILVQNCVSLCSAKLVLSTNLRNSKAK